MIRETRVTEPPNMNLVRARTSRKFARFLRKPACLSARALLLAIPLAIALTSEPAAAGAGGGLRWGLLDATIDEESTDNMPSATAPPAAASPTTGADAMPSPGPESRDIITPERQRQLDQLNALEEQQRRLQRELVRISSPDAGVERAQVEDRIRQLEQKMAERQSAYDADLQRLASNHPSDRKAEEQLRRRVHELQSRLADEQRPREAELSALREQARRLAAEDAGRAILDPVERAMRQDKLRAHILALEDSKQRVRNGEPGPVEPTDDPRSAEAFDALRRLDEIERGGVLPPPDRLRESRDRADALRRQAAELEQTEPNVAELAGFREQLAARGLDDPQEMERLLDERRDELGAQRALRAEQLREEAQDLEDGIFLAGLKDNPPLTPGAQFELKVAVSSKIHFEQVGDAQQTPVDITYRPATLTWVMGTLRWWDMQSVLEGPDGIYALEWEANQVLESSDPERGLTGDRMAFYRKAKQVLAAMSRVAQGSLKLVRDESVPVSGTFLGTSLVSWSKTEPSGSEEVPPTLISARMHAPGFVLENAHPDWAFSYATGSVTLVQATEQTLRDIERTGNELNRMRFDMNDADRKFFERMGRAHDRMREVINSISSRATQNATAIGRAGGVYELAINPLAFNNMPLEWSATVTKTGGGRRSPEVQSGTAKGSTYPNSSEPEIALGALGIADMIGNAKPLYSLVISGELFLGTADEKAFQNGVRVAEVSHGAEPRRDSLQSAEGIQILGQWLGAASGSIVLSSRGSSSNTSWDHEYTFAWELRPLSTTGSVLIGEPE